MGGLEDITAGLLTERTCQLFWGCVAKSFFALAPKPRFLNGVHNYRISTILVIPYPKNTTSEFQWGGSTFFVFTRWK